MHTPAWHYVEDEIQFVFRSRLGYRRVGKRNLRYRYKSSVVRNYMEDAQSCLNCVNESLLISRSSGYDDCSRIDDFITCSVIFNNLIP